MVHEKTFFVLIAFFD